MTVRTFLFNAGFVMLSATALAQTPQPPQAQQPRTPPQTAAPRTAGPETAPAPAVVPPPRREGQPINVRVDVTITDQRAGATSMKKTVSIVTAESMSGRIRSQAEYSGIGVVPLNVDTETHLLADGKIRLMVNLQYDLPAERAAPITEQTVVATLRKTMIQENLVVILESGKPLVVAQSADPVGDRQVTIEVKATVLR